MKKTIGIIMASCGGLFTLGAIFTLPRYNFNDVNQASQAIGGIAVWALVFGIGLWMMKSDGKKEDRPK